MQEQANNSIDLDELDRRILDQLQHDCALTNQELAARVHASPPTCLRRVRRLVATGVIARQVAIVAPEKLGSTPTAIVEIPLDVQGRKRVEYGQGGYVRVDSGGDRIIK